jgi:hypothetical protein
MRKAEDLVHGLEVRWTEAARYVRDRGTRRRWFGWGQPYVLSPYEHQACLIDEAINGLQIIQSILSKQGTGK